MKKLTMARIAFMKLGLLIAASLMFAAAASAADDFETCVRDSGDVAIDACTRVINSGRFRQTQVLEAYRNRGVEWYIKKDYDRAITDATSAIKMAADHSPSYLLRARAWEEKGDADKAWADVNAAIRTDFNVQAYVARGRYKEQKGDVAGAIADYKAAQQKLQQKYDYIGQQRDVEAAVEALKRLSAR